MTVETLIINACSWFDFIDLGGYQAATLHTSPRITASRFQLSVITSEKSLKLIHKESGVAIWYKHNEDDAKIVSGRFQDQDLIAKDGSTCAITAVLSDPSGNYLPRTIAVTLADRSQHSFVVYRSVKGTLILGHGSVEGTLVTKTGDVFTTLPWALITLKVAPATGSPLTFTAQADQHGEFRIALNGPKLQSASNPAAPLDASLSFKCATISDPETPANPDTFSARKVCNETQGDDSLKFSNTLDLKINPGKVNRLVSPGQEYLVLQTL